jgi:hypothetical protein
MIRNQKPPLQRKRMVVAQARVPSVVAASLLRTYKMPNTICIPCLYLEHVDEESQYTSECLRKTVQERFLSAL